jgi:hypothetical protein
MMPAAGRKATRAAVSAQIALDSVPFSALVAAQMQRAIFACRNAFATAGTGFLIHKHNALFIIGYGACRTGVETGGVFAVQTKHRHEITGNLAIGRYIFDAKHLNRPAIGCAVAMF